MFDTITLMATVVDLDLEREILDHVLETERLLGLFDPRSALQLIGLVRRRLDAAETRLTAGEFDKGRTDTQVEDLFDDGKTSKKEAKKKASRGKAADANPDLADRLAKGSMSTEQVDLIAAAAAETDGAAACDTDLIDQVAATTPEQGKKKTRKFVNDRRDADTVQSEHDKQRRRRTTYRFRNSDGDHVLCLQGDKHSIDQVEASINAAADALYRKDGGRDRAKHDHPRTSDQRRFDAACAFFTKKAATEAKPTNRRATVFVKTTVDQLTDADPTVITTADGKPLPKTVVDELSCGADFVAQIFSTQGELLWQGRKTRLATPAQIRGLVSRDSGCVLCGMNHSKCVAHHLLPFEAPGQGPTNIDNLALVCERCHHRIHDRQLMVVYQPETQTWVTRPATPHETVPSHESRRSSSGKAREQPKPDLHEQRKNNYRAAH